MTSTDLTTTADADVIRVGASGVAQFTDQGAALVRAMLCKEANDVELAFFASYCRRLDLDPFSGHVHLVQRGASGSKVCRPEVSLAGKLLIAERSGKYRGRTPYEWCGADGVWVDVWLKDEPPAAARVGVYRDGSPEPIWATALWSSYVGTKYGGAVNAMWSQHGPRMIAKCALSLGLSEALPAELGGVYTVEEMQQADNGSQVETKRDAALVTIAEAEQLTDEQAAILTAIVQAVRPDHEPDLSDYLAEDYAKHATAFVGYAVKDGAIPTDIAADLTTAATNLDLDVVRNLIAMEHAA